MSTPKYVERFVRLPEVLGELSRHPDGLPIAELARRFDVDPDQLHQDLLTFFVADLGGLGLQRHDTLEFLGPDSASDDDLDPREAVWVRIVDPRGVEETGIQYVDPGELALLFQAAQLLRDLEPDDPHLAGALEVLAEAVLGDRLEGVAPAQDWLRYLPILRQGADQLRRVHLTYSRDWSTGTGDRAIEPYLLTRTRRGWEVDAGPPDESGQLRTYLLSNIRSAALLDATFTPPADLKVKLERQRRTTRVRVALPQSARWAAEMYAEDVEVVQDRAEVVTLDLDLLPPLEHRLGILLLAAGPGAQVLEPLQYAGAAAALARDLWEHHARP